VEIGKWNGGRRGRFAVGLVLLTLALGLWPARLTARAFVVQLTTDNRKPTTLSGQILLRSFPSAPFPDASRAAGYTNNGKFFDAASHYSDSTVGIFIPAGFRPSTRRVDFLVHLHGWSNHVSQVLDRYQLREQVAASGLNAILIVPQGPRDAQDAGDGKLEHTRGGCAALMQDVARFLQAAGKTRTARIGRIILSAHSGGYKGASHILQIGGLTDHITDVLLFDAAYADLDGFADWQAAKKGRRLVSLFTDDTASGNLALMAALTRRHQPVAVLEAKDLAPRTLERRQALFIYTPDLPHDETMQGRGYYGLFLRTSGKRWAVGGGL